MKPGVIYSYDPEKKSLKPVGQDMKGLSPRQRKIKQKHKKLDKTGSDPFWPIHA